MIRNKTNITSSQKKGGDKTMKKTMTTYPTNKKFTDPKFQKKLESFKEWEKRRKERLAKLEKEKREREDKLMKDPQVNKEANLKFNLNPKNYTAVERLYTQDRIKREEKKIALTKIYTPTFRPTLYTNKYNLGRVVQQQNKPIKNGKKVKVLKTKGKTKTKSKKILESEDEENEENEDNLDIKNYRPHKIVDEESNDENEENGQEERKPNLIRNKGNNKKERRNLSVEKIHKN